jgi:hypothetical protein
MDVVGLLPRSTAGTIDREFHVKQAAVWFGAEFRVLGDDDCPTFSPEVLESLDRLAGGRVAWDPAALAWRLGPPQPIAVP